MSAATYTLANGRKVRTTAQRRYLLVGQYKDARPSVDSSTPDLTGARRTVTRLRRDFPFTTWTIIDQHTREEIQ
jgi:hypothetical protein